MNKFVAKGKKLTLIIFLIFLAFFSYRLIAWNIKVRESKRELWVIPTYSLETKIAYVQPLPGNDSLKEQSDIIVSDLGQSYKDNFSKDIRGRKNLIRFGSPVWSPSKKWLAFVGVEALQANFSFDQIKVSTYIRSGVNDKPIKIYEYAGKGSPEFILSNNPTWSKNEDFLIIYDASISKGKTIGEYKKVIITPPFTSEAYDNLSVINLVSRHPDNKGVKASSDPTVDDKSISPNAKYRLILKSQNCGLAAIAFGCNGENKIELQKVNFLGFGPSTIISNNSGLQPVWFANSKHFLITEFEKIIIYDTSGKIIQTFNGIDFDI